MNRLAAVSYGSWGTPSGCLTGENQHAWYEMYSYTAAGAVAAKQMAVNGGGAVTANWTYTTSGRPSTISYPMAISGSTVTDTFTYGYDGMDRPVSLTGNELPSPLTWVQNVQYDFASRMSSLQYRVSPSGSSFTTEAIGYNNNGQLTSLAWSGSGSPVTGSLTYSYSSTQNNGQITQVVDTVSGETISYQYDSLKRLTSASSTPNVGGSPAAWTQTFQYDDFGNLTAKVLNGTTTSIGTDPATNRLTSASYDSNGNMTSGVGSTFTYDVANRVLTAAAVSGGTEYYGYAPDNRRIFKKLASGAEEYTFYGAGGEKLGVYDLATSTVAALRTSVWLASRLISENGSAVFQDRVGTNRAGGARFYPYGEEISSTSDDRQKFGTYTRDGYTGLDYADQRYYASSYGRFDSADPYRASAGADDPASWNRYAYVLGDPVNYNDARGLAPAAVYSDSFCDPSDPYFILDDSCFLEDWGGGGILSPTAAAAQYLDQFYGVPGFDWDWTGNGLGINIGYNGQTLYGISGPYLQHVTSVNWDFIWSLAPTPGSTLADTLTAILGKLAGPIIGILLNPSTLGGWGDSFPSVTQVEQYCTPKGAPVVVPSTNVRNKGGQASNKSISAPMVRRGRSIL